MHTATIRPRPAAVGKLPPAVRKLEQIRAVSALPELSPGAARLGAAVLAAPADDGLISVTKTELAEMGKTSTGLGITYLRELELARILEYSCRGEKLISIRVTFKGERLTNELETLSRRLREARRDRA